MSGINGGDDHPMRRLRRPIIRTMPIQRAAAAINVALEAGFHGIDHFGGGRIGKDEGIKYLFANPGWTPFPASHYSLLFPNTTQPGDSQFFNTCLLSANQRFIASSPGNFSQRRFVNHMLDQMEREGTELMLFRIAEANRMTNAHWDHLLSLDNEIEDAGRRLFLISLHQTDATRDGRESIDSSPLPQILGRFRLASHNYTGLLWMRPESEIALAKAGDDLQDDVTIAASEYDLALYWPLGSGVSYTQFFAPRAFANGWRFASQVDEYRSVITQVRVENGLSPLAPWAMKTFETFAYLVLVRIAGEDPSFLRLSPEQIRAAILQSGYVELEVSRTPRRI